MDFGKFDAGALHYERRARLGSSITDPDDERWGYTQIQEAIGFGEVVRSSKHADLITQNPGEVSAACAVGETILRTSGDLVLGTEAADLAGAIGIISAGAGIGQQFYILSNDNNNAEVFVLTGNADKNLNKGWAMALDATSRFTLFFPGQGKQGDGVSDIVEGILQVPGGASSEDIGKYCWVKRSGLTPVKADGSARDLLSGDLVISTAAGLVQAAYPNASPTAAQAIAATRGTIGRALVATSYDNTQDYLALVNLNLPDTPQSYAFVDVDNAYNVVEIGR